MTTGEEDEDTRHQVRGKLFQLDAARAYKERGMGILKIKVRKSSETGARLGEWTGICSDTAKIRTEIRFLCFLTSYALGSDVSTDPQCGTLPGHGR